MFNISKMPFHIRAIPRPARLIVWIFLLPVFFSGCVGTRYLKEGEYLLYNQEIKDANKVSEEALSEYYRQEPNRRFPIIPFAPYVWLYQIGQKRYDKDELRQEKEALAEKYDRKIEESQGKRKKVKRLKEKKDTKISKIERSIEEGNLLMRWGEPLAIYDSSLAQTTRAQMESYLHTKGFFNGEVSHATKIKGKKVTSIYKVIENKPYIIDTITYTTNNATLTQLIEKYHNKPLIKQGEVYDQDKFGAERDRLDDIFKNNGFFDFSRQYIEFKVDSTVGDYRVSVNTIINEPANRAKHKQFGLDSVNFTTDADVRGMTGERTTSTYNDITYRYYEYRYYKKILGRRVFIHPDSLYSREETLQTQRQLSNLDIFKFININYDTTGGKFVANIYASPLKKYQTANEVGLNVSQGFPGPFVNSSLKIRNVFGGMEILEISGRAGIEGVPPATQIQTKALKSTDIGGNVGLTFPQFVFPLPNRLKSRLGNLNPKTTIQTGYNYVSRPEYTRSNFKNTFSYSWQKGQTNVYNFTPIDVNFIRSRNISQAFLDVLAKQDSAGIPLSRSFKPSFVSSMSFSAIFSSSNYGATAETTRPASYFKIYTESGGTLLNFFGTELLTRKNLEYFKFVKINPDFRQYVPLSKISTFAYRLNIGVAVPYGQRIDGNVLPYEKYFFAGGSNSIRAWRPRRLGPGAAKPDSVSSENGYFVYSLEQPGEILMEASVELRRKLFGFVNGAFFIDAGNVWRILEVEGEPDATFRFDDFYKQIAVGSGIGLRFDFTFLILRFDYGVKMYDPARDAGQRWIGQKFTVGQEISQGVFNIGIGYPF